MQMLDQQEIIRKRLSVVAGLMALGSIYLLGQLISFQYQSPTVVSYLQQQASYNYNQNQRTAAARGIIYDRDGNPLASNTFDYEIGVSPNLVEPAARRNVATQLASVLDLNELEVYESVTSDETWVSLKKPVSPMEAEQIRDLDLLGITIDSEPRRLYTQGTLGAQVLGFVAGDASGLQGFRGYNGIEGYYEDELAGRVRDQTVSRIPFDLPTERAVEDRGSDLVLTIDRDIQFLVESELQFAVAEHGATGGSIIVMNPRTGDILGMSSYPSFDPNAYFDADDPDALRNPIISDEYEPGSVMKVITVAAGIDSGVVAPEDTYVDNGVFEIGGITIYNWDRQPKGVMDMTQLLVQSLNVGAATVSTEMGPELFYQRLEAFGFGRSTGIDLEGEAIGTMFTPYDAEWSDSNLGTNSFGQGIAVTPLQMLTAVSALANDGLMMQPHIVDQVVDGNRIYPSQPSALGRPISPETAEAVTQMMIRVVEEGAPMAQVPGYSVAGKTGTAEISTPIGYERDASIVTFVGFLPADDPQVAVLVKLDRPVGYWGSQVAAPVFSRLAERLVVVMEIPPDDIRFALAAEGGAVNEIGTR